MTVDEAKTLFPPVEWRVQNPSTPYPLVCRMGPVAITISETRTPNGSFYRVSWSDGCRQFSLQAPNPLLARVNAEVHARMLFLRFQHRQGKNLK